MSQDDGFLSRWSRRKVQAGKGVPLPPEPTPAERPPAPDAPETAATATQAARGLPLAPAAIADGQARLPDSAQPTAAAVGDASTAPAAPPPPTLDDALQLKPSDTDFSRFVGRNVDPQVRHTALRTLFSDPHFNVMDRLDVYIDDYGKPDPLPAGMLRQMVQSSLLGLFDHEKTDEAKSGAAATATQAATQTTALGDASSTAPNAAAPDAVPASVGGAAGAAHTPSADVAADTLAHTQATQVPDAPADIATTPLPATPPAAAP